MGEREGDEREGHKGGSKRKRGEIERERGERERVCGASKREWDERRTRERVG